VTPQRHVTKGDAPQLRPESEMSDPHLPLDERARRRRLAMHQAVRLQGAFEKDRESVPVTRC
jgi:hypothetical protein